MEVYALMYKPCCGTYFSCKCTAALIVPFEWLLFDVHKMLSL